ncbi:SDR family NAD(P)-dependent oxidoreductase [Aureimonas sp. SK2]|uniref:SDR family NAD(P)-dependent oxidoreductase n=1 Tax=Aureimonas sp. SK2 TaxID=3015992 RepID=UPI002443BF8A|nr:SDR family oxidoreductase [Aureimonas sp. SK2]
MTNRFQNKVVVVTGATSGIGLAAAKAFSQEGASVFITGRRQETLDAAVKEIGGRVTGVRGDMAKLADIDRLYDAIQQQHDQIDVIYANAGGGEFAPLGAITEEQFDATFDTNVKGTLFTVQKALPLLKDGASVVLTGSTAGSEGTPAFSVYSASKAAVRNFARNWILDLKDRRIRVNVVSPGATRTPGLVGLAGEDAGKQRELLDFLGTRIPLGRVGEAQEIANAVLFLASDEASFVNGVEFFVDGGQAQV